MTEMEVATMQGYARVTVPGHNDKRNRDLRAKQGFRPPTPNDGRWAHDLAGKMAAMGFGGAVHRGRSTDGPVH